MGALGISRLQPRPQGLLVFQYSSGRRESCHIGKREDPGDDVGAAGKTSFSYQKLHLVPRLRDIKQIVIVLNLLIWVVFG